MKPLLHETVARWAEDHQFGPELKFTEAASIGLPANGPKASGYYLLRFENDSYYLGESVDLRSRMGDPSRHFRRAHCVSASSGLRVRVRS